MSRPLVSHMYNPDDMIHDADVCGNLFDDVNLVPKCTSSGFEKREGTAQDSATNDGTANSPGASCGAVTKLSNETFSFCISMA